MKENYQSARKLDPFNEVISPIKVVETERSNRSKPRQTLANVFWGQNSEILDSIQKMTPMNQSLSNKSIDKEIIEKF